MSMYPHWKPVHLEVVKTLESYIAMRDFALALLKDLPAPIVQVCGPLTTGGKGSYEANVEVLHKGIHWLAARGKTVFDQRPFEDPMFKVIQAQKKTAYPHNLLEEFYLPLFQSGHIKELHFVPGWETSIGATWEYEQGKALGIAIFHLPPEFMES